MTRFSGITHRPVDAGRVETPKQQPASQPTGGGLRRGGIMGLGARVSNPESAMGGAARRVGLSALKHGGTEALNSAARNPFAAAKSAHKGSAAPLIKADIKHAGNKVKFGIENVRHELTGKPISFGNAANQFMGGTVGEAPQNFEKMVAAGSDAFWKSDVMNMSTPELQDHLGKQAGIAGQAVAGAASAAAGAVGNAASGAASAISNWWSGGNKA